MSDLDAFAEWFKVLRAAMGWSQKEAAAACGLSTGYVGLIETSQRIPSASRTAQIVERLTDAGVRVKLDEVLATRDRARQDLARSGLNALGSGRVEAIQLTDLLAATDLDDPTPSPAKKPKIGRPSRAQRLRDQIRLSCEDLDENELRYVAGYVARLTEESP